VLFPNMLVTGNSGRWQQRSMQIRVPIDDENTMHYWYSVFVPPVGAVTPPRLLNDVPVYEPKIRNADGTYNLDFVDGQDIYAWVTQGRIADRTQEVLGASDQGIVFYRRMLLRELDKVERGEDPMGTIRDSAKKHVEVHVERGKQIHADGFRRVIARNAVSFSPIYEDLVEVFTRALPDGGAAYATAS
jgi:5,5'-dehydrodivanillate O-demethylase